MCFTGALWVCVVLNPSCVPSDKDYWQQLLEQWSISSVCPLEDADIRPTNDVLMSNMGINSTSSKYNSEHMFLWIHVKFDKITICVLDTSWYWSLCWMIIFNKWEGDGGVFQQLERMLLKKPMIKVGFTG